LLVSCLPNGFEGVLEIERWINLVEGDLAGLCLREQLLEAVGVLVRGLRVLLDQSAQLSVEESVLKEVR